MEPSVGFGSAGVQCGVWECGSPARDLGVWSPVWGLGVRKPSEVMGAGSTVLATHPGSKECLCWRTRYKIKRCVVSAWGGETGKGLLSHRPCPRTGSVMGSSCSSALAGAGSPGASPGKHWTFSPRSCVRWQEGLGPHPCFRVILCSDVARKAGSSHQNRCLARGDGISTVVLSSLACLAKCQEGRELWESRQGARRAQRAPRQTEPYTRSCCQAPSVRKACGRGWDIAEPRAGPRSALGTCLCWDLWGWLLCGLSYFFITFCSHAGLTASGSEPAGGRKPSLCLTPWVKGQR